MKTVDKLQTMLAGADSYPRGHLKPLAPRITCKDGTILSVQASRTHYASPRYDEGPYNAVEVGYPTTEPPESWAGYCENWDNPTQTVYGYIPIEMVADWIDEHGGIA